MVNRFSIAWYYVWYLIISIVGLLTILDVDMHNSTAAAAIECGQSQIIKVLATQQQNKMLLIPPMQSIRFE